MKKYVILLCALISNMHLYCGLKAGAQWEWSKTTSTKSDKKLLLYGYQDFFLTKIKNNVDKDVHFTLFHLILKEQDKDKFSDIDCFPGYTDYSNILNLALNLSSYDENFFEKRDNFLKNEYKTLDNQAKSKIDNDVLKFLKKIEEFWKKKSEETETYQELQSRAKSEVTILRLKDELIQKINKLNSFKTIYRSYFLNSCLDSGFEEQEKSSKWLTDFIHEANHYLNAIFFDKLIEPRQGKYTVGCMHNEFLFFLLNKRFAHKEGITLKAVLPSQIITDKNYFKNVDLKKLPKITGTCADWQYKYLLDKPLTRWESFKLKALSWKKYLIPTAVAGAGLIGAAYWWNKKRSSRNTPTKSRSKFTPQELVPVEEKF